MGTFQIFDFLFINLRKLVHLHSFGEKMSHSFFKNFKNDFLGGFCICNKEVKSLASGEGSGEQTLKSELSATSIAMEVEKGTFGSFL